MPFDRQLLCDLMDFSRGHADLLRVLSVGLSSLHVTCRVDLTSPDMLLCRVSARAELSLRQRLSQREDRISELKDALAAAQHSPRQQHVMPQHRSRSSSPTSHVADHAAYHSYAQFDHATSHSHAVPVGRYHNSYNSRSEVQPFSGQCFGGSQAEHKNVEHDLHHVPCNEEQVCDANHKQQLGSDAPKRPARLPYFTPKSAETIANSQISDAQADQQPAATREVVHIQPTKMPTGSYLHVPSNLFIPG